MIMQLVKGKIKITPMRIPEELKRIYIQYAYEFGTNHLKPVLTINKLKYEGDRFYIDIGEGFTGDNVDMKVELLDSAGTVIKTYKGTYLYSKYCTFGTKPIRPDIMDYVHELEARVRQLEEEGEVI